jgi:hypothetical protein
VETVLSRRKRRGAGAPVREIKAYTMEGGALNAVHALPGSRGGMLNERCIRILKKYAKQLETEEWAGPSSTALDHVAEMIPKAIEFFQERRREKGFRWLGFIQGVLWMEKIYTIQEMKDHNRPDGQIDEEE